MRRTFIIIAATALALVPLTAAQASTKHYSISVSVSPKVIDVTPGAAHDGEKVTVSGKVTGGPVRGRTVHLYAINSNDGSRQVDLSTASLSSTGTFKKSWHPVRGGRWYFKVTKATYGSYRGATSSTHYADAFEWVGLKEFYKAGNNVPSETPLVGPVVAHNEKLTAPGDTSTNFSVEYFVQGGASAVFNMTGYRCKKISMHVGVSLSSVVHTGTYRTLLDTFRLGTYSGERSSWQVHQSGTYTTTASSGHFNKVTIQVDPFAGPYAVDDTNTPDVDETTDASSIRVLVGVPKVFCTYPYTS
ncbi:MAG: hypothetical protein JWQ70_3109 [Aeromicrobium sp.]|nr:hypothetical protein [Aeromicrobium sp.]